MEIRIDNYKNIKNFVLPVKDNRLILLGPNGAGKTNILEAIFYNHCTIDGGDGSFARRFLLTLNISSIKQDELFPNAKLLNEWFPHAEDESLPDILMAFLENMYQQFDRPLMKKLIKDALDTLKFTSINKKFDPSPLAITRLIILIKIYQLALENNEKYIILMDSPELFAHPTLMDELVIGMNLLHDVGCMVIVSTHSERIISRLFTRFEDIARITKKPDGLIEAFIPDMQEVRRQIHAFYDSDEYLTHSFSKSSHADEGLLKLLNEDIDAYLITAFRDHLITVFFSQVIILGEGSSEDVLFDYIDNQLHPSWISEHQVGFITCMGKSTMPLYFIFLNCMGVKTFLLYDYDNNDNRVHAAYHEAFENYHKAHKNMFREFHLMPDLEHYLQFSEGEKIQSIIKPVNIFNYTYLRQTENRPLKTLLSMMKLNVSILAGWRTDDERN